MFDSDGDREYFVERGLVDSILNVMSAKGEDLQEVRWEFCLLLIAYESMNLQVPLVTLLYLSVHPTIPINLLKKGVDVVAAGLLNCKDHIIRELCVILLKALALHDSEAVEKVLSLDYLYYFYHNYSILLLPI